MSGIGWSELHFPDGLSSGSAATAIRALAARTRGSAGPLALELHVRRDEVRWLLGCPPKDRARVASLLSGQIPGMRLSPVDQQELVPASRSAAVRNLVVELRLTNQRRRLTTDHSSAVTVGLLSLGGQLGTGESVRVQWLIGPAVRRSAPPRPGPKASAETIRAARSKAEDLLVVCAGRVAISTVGGGRGFGLLSEVMAALGLSAAPGVSLVRGRRPRWWAAWLFERRQLPLWGQMVLRADELAALVGWPIDLAPGLELPGINGLKRLPADPAVLNRSDRMIGVAGAPGQRGNLTLDTVSALRHLHVLGPTGVGKSTLLARLVLADIAAGIPVVVIDPKGDLVDDIWGRLPARCTGDVVVLDPSDPAPVGLPTLREGSASAEGIYHVLASLWSGSWGPRMGDIIHSGLSTLAIANRAIGSSWGLVALGPLLSDAGFRRPLVNVAVATDPVGLGSFWAWFDGLSADKTSVVLGPVMNKLRAFTSRPDLRAVLGQSEPRFDLSEIFTQKRSLLVRLPAGQIGTESAALLGSLVIAELWRTIQTRAGAPPLKRFPVMVYLDEFQQFLRLPLDLGDALAQARGLGVGLTLAHQHLGQLGTDLRAAVLANTGSGVCFRLGADDAAIMARGHPELDLLDLTRLGAHQVYARLMAGGTTQRYAFGRTLPLGPPSGNLTARRRANAARWGIDRDQTAAELAAQFSGQSPVADVQASGFGWLEGDQP